MYRKFLPLIAIFLTLSGGSIFAQEKNMTGQWKSFDERTGEERFVILIEIDESGNLGGKITGLFQKPGEDQNPVCENCKGEKKNTPLSGLTILWGFTPDHIKDTRHWNSGKLLDPKTGIEYDCNLVLSETGDEIEVLGYLGFSLAGRKQKWVRISEK